MGVKSFILKIRRALFSCLCKDRDDFNPIYSQHHRPTERVRTTSAHTRPAMSDSEDVSAKEVDGDSQVYEFLSSESMPPVCGGAQADPEYRDLMEVCQDRGGNICRDPVGGDFRHPTQDTNNGAMLNITPELSQELQNHPPLTPTQFNRFCEQHSLSNDDSMEYFSLRESPQPLSLVQYYLRLRRDGPPRALIESLRGIELTEMAMICERFFMQANPTDERMGNIPAPPPNPSCGPTGPQPQRQPQPHQYQHPHPLPHPNIHQPHQQPQPLPHPNIYQPCLQPQPQQHLIPCTQPQPQIPEPQPGPPPPPPSQPPPNPPNRSVSHEDACFVTRDLRIADMRFRLKNRIALKLDPERQDARDWRLLACLLGVEDDIRGSLSRRESPTLALFDHWKIEENATAGTLYDMLTHEGLTRSDVAKLLIFDS